MRKDKIIYDLFLRATFTFTRYSRVMSFEFSWPDFDSTFIQRAKIEVEKGLNKNRPSNICDDIIITDLDMGRIPPTLCILEISELTLNQFQGLFKLEYAGDLKIHLQTKVQVNPIGTLGFEQIANKSLIAPMKLSLSNFNINAIVSVRSSERGITVNFKNDPLKSLQVDSTFDYMPNVKHFLQTEIEVQLQNFLRTELPLLIHKHSLKMRSSPQASSKSDPNLKLYYVKSSSIIHRTVSGYVEFDDRELVSKDDADPAKYRNLSFDGNRLSLIANSQLTLSLYTLQFKNAVIKAGLKHQRTRSSI